METQIKRGRPPKKVQWPQGEFTLNDVFPAFQDKMTRVTLQNHVNRDLNDGLVIKIRENKTSGRPVRVFKLA
jgi:hypothetical protein